MTVLVAGKTGRRRVRVAGVVQGVGFRPFVHRLATELALAGRVENDSAGVLIEVEGPLGSLAAFEERLLVDAPPLARIDSVEGSTLDPLGESGFSILESHAFGSVRTFVAPDVAVCDDCVRELFDPGDRRYRYPFVNCTNCGPRFTITTGLPYDRPSTTMRGFRMCGLCAGEYVDPADRRFHAQPVACARCGPRIAFEVGGRRVVLGTEAVLAAAHEMIGAGGIVAVKGLGGYHLACDGASTAAVAELRRRKQRPDKPFALMVADLGAARRLAEIGPAEAGVLMSAARPIVLLRRRRGRRAGGLELVAPANPYLGIMLPYTPLHHLLFHPVPGSAAPVPEVLVMTSGNLSEEPICYEDGDARRLLGRIADGFLTNDRAIHVPCDDSVVRIEAGEELPVRRSRGYAPLPIRLGFESPPLLAVGGELKNTFCVLRGGDAWMSQHIGDMGSAETLRAFERSTRQLCGLYEVSPVGVAADLHPSYQTRRHAEERSGLPVFLVQHHHAHVAAVMAEHRLPAGERVLGYAFDGTGYGTDGAIWGGEVLLAGYESFERLGHLSYVPLPGGDATIRKPYRAGLSYLWAAGVEWAGWLAPVGAAAPGELRVLERQLERGFGCVPTSSMGRLFDALSSLVGLRHEVSYEAQAAIELEALAESYQGDPCRYELALGAAAGGAGAGAGAGAGGAAALGTAGTAVIEVAPLVRAVVADLASGAPRGAIAAGFHLAVADLIATSAERLCRTSGVRRVALSGGVFQNVLLVRLARAALAERGIEVLVHRLVPPNDGGLALGQAAIAAARAGAAGAGAGAAAARAGAAGAARAGAAGAAAGAGAATPDGSSAGSSAGQRAGTP